MIDGQSVQGVIDVQFTQHPSSSYHQGFVYNLDINTIGGGSGNWHIQHPQKIGFQQKARKDGRDFETKVVTALAQAGWTMWGTRKRVHGVEIDIIASPPGGPECLIECKGGNLIGRSGLARTDTVKKSIGTAWTLHRRQYKEGTGPPKPYLLVTSMMPKPNTQGFRMLQEAFDGGLFNNVGSINDTISWGIRNFSLVPWLGNDRWHNLAKLDPSGFVRVV